MELGDFLKLFQAKGQHLHWERLDDDHVVAGAPGAAIERDQAYFILRMKEMYLRRTRVLWRKYYPLLHGFAAHAGQEEHSIAGPGQLRDLGEANLERIVNLNHRLAGPTPYEGDSVDILVGLYSIPGQDAAKALVEAVGTIASLAGPTLAGATAIATAVRGGVDSILGLGETKLQLGVRDSFFVDNPLRAGYHLGIAAPAADVRTERLWLREGRLVSGEDPVAAKPYEQHDYFVLAMERLTERDDWRRLPGIADFEERFAVVLADGAADTKAKAERLNQVWPEFQETVRRSRLLTTPDRERIAVLVKDDLAARLDALRKGGPFETRSLDGKLEAKPASEYDFLDVDDMVDPSDDAFRGRAAVALADDRAAFA